MATEEPWPSSHPVVLQSQYIYWNALTFPTMTRHLFVWFIYHSGDPNTEAFWRVCGRWNRLSQHELLLAIDIASSAFCNSQQHLRVSVQTLNPDISKHGGNHWKHFGLKSLQDLDIGDRGCSPGFNSIGLSRPEDVVADIELRFRAKSR